MNNVPHVFHDYNLAIILIFAVFTARATLALPPLYYLQQFRPSVRLSVRHTPVLCQNDGTFHGPVCTVG